jgi:protein-disulfide isomerase
MSTPAERKAKIQAAAPKQQGPNRIILATVIAVLAIVGVVVGTVIAKNTSGGSGTVAAGSLPKGVTESGGGISTERAKAGSTGPVVDLYEDFQCPSCEQLEQVLGPKLRELETAGTIRLRYHVLTFLDRNLGNDSSSRAANAAMCAADQGRFGAYHDVVYANQPSQEGKGWTDAELEAFAQQAGITGGAMTSWQTCVKDESHKAYIASVQSASDTSGVTGTPTVMVDGRKFDLQGVTPDNLGDKILAAAK